MRHTCILDDGGTPNRKCHACEDEKSISPSSMDVAEARRCVKVCAEYLRNRDESPFAAKDLEMAVQILVNHGSR